MSSIYLLFHRVPKEKIREARYRGTGEEELIDQIRSWLTKRESFALAKTPL